MENLKTKKICVIGDSQWCQKLMDITYEMGVLGGVVESNLKRYMFLLESYPGIFYTLILKGQLKVTIAIL